MKKNSIEFKPSFVAFLDILGFSEMVNKDCFEEKAETIQKEIFQAVNVGLFKGTGKISPPENIKYKIFSDSIILSIGYNPKDIWTERVKALRFLCSAVEQIQFQLAITDTWIRGGISHGTLSHTDINILGKGLVNAFKLEKLAIFPRVLVSPATIYENVDPENEHSNRSHCVRQINDQYDETNYSGQFLFDHSNSRAFTPKNDFKDDYPFFINYLNKFPLVSRSIQKHIIITNLKHRIQKSEDPKVYQKFRWVVDYLLSLCHAEPNASDYYRFLSRL